MLLDAGAGSAWKYVEASTGFTFTRSEGLGVASVHMFESGLFSSDSNQPYRVDGATIQILSKWSHFHTFLASGLEKVTAEKTAAAMQVSESNPMVGIEGRASLLFNLSKALRASPQFFGEDGRPGNLIGMFDLLLRELNH